MRLEGWKRGRLEDSPSARSLNFKVSFSASSYINRRNRVFDSPPLSCRQIWSYFRRTFISTFEKTRFLRRSRIKVATWIL